MRSDSAVIHVSVSFEGELRDHLHRTPPAATVELTLELPAGLRDVIQSLGVPHPECGAVIVNGEARAWDCRVADGDEISVTPRFPLDAPPAHPRFLLDDHLGKLARHLRMLGLDADHRSGADDADLARRSVAEARTLLTRDRGLLMRAAVRDGRFVREVDPMRQAIEIVESFALDGVVAPLTRCLECNDVLEAAPQEEVDSQVPACAASLHERFGWCPTCRRVYWEGTHVDSLRERIRLILEAAEG